MFYVSLDGHAGPWEGDRHGEGPAPQTCPISVRIRLQSHVRLPAATWGSSGLEKTTNLNFRDMSGFPEADPEMGIGEEVARSEAGGDAG